MNTMDYGILNLVSAFAGAHPVLFLVLVSACVVTFFLALKADARQGSKGKGNSTSEAKELTESSASSI
jgi:hypothetical protein